MLQNIFKEERQSCSMWTFSLSEGERCFQFLTLIGRVLVHYTIVSGLENWDRIIT